ncbi:hypothetical protein ACLKA7_005881 [Drosophila subpalustris]
MADGFKKYFNGTTLNGRANVAKATYATLAVFYLLYRVRRSKGAPKDPKDAEPLDVKDQCSCDADKPESPVGYCDPRADAAVPPPTAPEKDCAVCRDRSERRAAAGRAEGCSDEPPPSPPPPPPPAGGQARRKCPCEDPHRHIETPKQTTHQPQMRQDLVEDQVHPAREIIGHMQEAASRVLRNVIGAVLGDSVQCPGSAGASSASAAIYESEETCHAHAAAAVEALESVDQLEDDGSDYGADSQLLNRQRRTAPRSCVPTTNSSGDSDLTSSALDESQSQSQSQSQSLPESQSQSRYRGFDDDFASEMFFEDFEE